MRERRTAALLALTMSALFTVAACSSSPNNSSPTGKQTFCGLLVAFRASNDSLDADLNSGDATAVKTAITRLVSQGKALQKRAPDDIESDVATVSTFIGKLDSLFAKYGYDLTKLSADDAGVEQYATINDPDVQAALDQLRAYGDVDCAASATTTTVVSG